ncbi:TIGR02584 family CRISPR-associated protein [candidate division KSB1 bacterium]|nr:TIGR02584 family CRISPR-associated protein [candidate division KSB1 bacterium]
MESKHILVSVIGVTPQILTETLYGLMVEKGINISEIRIITTKEGESEIKEHLLKPGSNKFLAFCKDYDLNPATIKFDMTSIKVAQDQTGQFQHDVIRVEDCEPMITVMIKEIEELTKDPDTTLHCSLAGGRKTMSVFMAFAMQLFGRPQDILYHVIAHPDEFQSHPDFFYIPPIPKKLKTTKGKKISTTKASIIVMEVPYVRLREKMVDLFGEIPNSFDEMVKLSQSQVEQMPDLPVLAVNLKGRYIEIGKTHISLSPFQIALYCYYAERSLNRPDNIPVKNYDDYFEKAEGGSFFPSHGLTRLKQIYEAVAPYGIYTRFIQSLQNGQFPFNRACEHFSRIKSIIRTEIENDVIADYYIISPIGPYGKSYGIKIDKSKIRIIG